MQRTGYLKAVDAELKVLLETSHGTATVRAYVKERLIESFIIGMHTGSYLQEQENSNGNECAGS